MCTINNILSINFEGNGATILKNSKLTIHIKILSNNYLTKIKDILCNMITNHYNYGTNNLIFNGKMHVHDIPN